MSRERLIYLISNDLDELDMTLLSLTMDSVYAGAPLRSYLSREDRITLQDNLLMIKEMEDKVNRDKKMLINLYEYLHNKISYSKLTLEERRLLNKYSTL